MKACLCLRSADVQYVRAVGESVCSLFTAGGTTDSLSSGQRTDSVLWLDIYFKTWLLAVRIYFFDCALELCKDLDVATITSW